LTILSFSFARKQKMKFTGICRMVLISRRRSCFGLIHADICAFCSDSFHAFASRFVSAACISRTPPGPSCSWLIESTMMVFAPFATQCSIAAR
jgi:hypothetical protein